MQCKNCGRPTTTTGTGLCDRCWELERRVEADPGLAARALARALIKPKDPSPVVLASRKLEGLGREAVICHVVDSATPFATWERDPSTGQMYWGHYFTADQLLEAVIDFRMRGGGGDKAALVERLLGAARELRQDALSVGEAVLRALRRSDDPEAIADGLEEAARRAVEEFFEGPRVVHLDEDREDAETGWYWGKFDREGVTAGDSSGPFETREAAMADMEANAE